MYAAQQRKAHPAQAGSAPRKPLYLSTSQPLRVGLDGEALTLKNDTGTQRFPLARIARIVCNRHVDWSGQALAACLTNSISITWQDGHGAALGGAAARLATPSLLHPALELYLELADWTGRYGNWLRCRRMAILCAVARRARENGHPFPSETFSDLKREYVYLGRLSPLFPDEGLGWCHAAAMQQLAEEQLLARYRGYGGEPLELAEDLAGLLWAALNLECGGLAEAGTTQSRMMFFESWLHEHPNLLREHLAHLARHVARENEAWL